MANDAKKAKIESLRKSISTLETQKTVISAEGGDNKRKLDSINRMLTAFEKMIEAIKKS